MRAIPIRRAGNRSVLFMGGDRELVMFSGVLAFTLIFEAQSWQAVVYGLLLWFLALALFRRMAKADPLMRRVWMRSRRYAEYYPPRATPFRLNTRSQWRNYR